MSGPKSFKDMLRPPSRGGVNAVHAPLNPSPLRTISTDLQKERDLQFKKMKAFLNAQRCPLCGSQLEGPVRFDETEMYCVANGASEYKATYQYGVDIPVKVRMVYYASQHNYEVVSFHVGEGKYRNVVYKLDASLNSRAQQTYKKELFNYEGKLLILDKGLDEEKLLSKLKLYTIFS